MVTRVPVPGTHVQATEYRLSDGPVRRVHTRGQAVRAVVHSLDRLLVVVNRDDRRDGTERFIRSYHPLSLRAPQRVTPDHHDGVEVSPALGGCFPAVNTCAPARTASSTCAATLSTAPREVSGPRFVVASAGSAARYLRASATNASTNESYTSRWT